MVPTTKRHLIRNSFDGNNFSETEFTSVELLAAVTSFEKQMYYFEVESEKWVTVLTNIELHGVNNCTTFTGKTKSSLEIENHRNQSHCVCLY